MFTRLRTAGSYRRLPLARLVILAPLLLTLLAACGNGGSGPAY